MRAVVQRVTHASVTVEGEVVGAIGNGLLVLLGVATDDTAEEADRLAGKVARLRIFESADGKLDLSVLDTGGEILVVSQFTLLADATKGNRPGFSGAARPGGRETARRAVLRCPLRPGRPGRDRRLRRPDERRARQRRPCHDHPRLNRTVRASPMAVDGAILSLPHFTA